MRLAWVLIGIGFAALGWGFAPRAVGWTARDGRHYLAAVEAGQVHLACTNGTAIAGIAVLPSPGLTTLAVGQWHGAPALLGARGTRLLRLDLARRRWQTLGRLPAPIREIHPAPDGAPYALVLTGTPARPVPAGGAVWRVGWRLGRSCVRVTAVKRIFRPWQCWWTHVDDEQRLACATYKATPYVPFLHNCMFLFAWDGRRAEKRWLGSRLSRPYLDAVHADLRGDGQWRMAAVEETRDGKHGLSVYHPIGFGYEGEWRLEAMPGLEHIAAIGGLVLCAGHDAAGVPCAWRLLPQADAYRLVALPVAPPTLEAVTQVDTEHLAGWWQAAWHVLNVPQS